MASQEQLDVSLKVADYNRRSGLMIQLETYPSQRTHSGKEAGMGRDQTIHRRRARRETQDG